MKKKVVIKVSMNDQKSRKKALKTVVGCSGVESAGLKGKEKDEIEVTGDGIDAVDITTMLRKNVGYAEIVSVSPVGDKKDGEKKEDDGKKDGSKANDAIPSVILAPYPYTYNGVPHPHTYEYEIPDSNYNPSCTIM